MGFLRVVLPRWAVGSIVAFAVLAARDSRAAGAPPTAAPPPPPVSTAFFYGPALPPALLAHYDRVVVEPDHFAWAPASPRAEVFAYVSVGEVNRTRPWHRDVPVGAVLAANDAWGSDVVDTRRAEWRAFLLDRVIEPIWSKGFRGFFFDTLDSIELVTQDPAARRAFASGVADVASSLKERHPDAKILFNRGFEALPWLRHPIDGLVAESLLETWDASVRRYLSMPAADTESLRARLEGARARWHLPVTVIDYVPPSRPEARRDTARRIAAMGYAPWVTSPGLDEVGVGEVEIVPRKIRMLYKGSSDGALAVDDAVVLAAPVLEYLGYTVEYLDVRQPLPEEDATGQVAGVVVYAPDGADDGPAIRRWLIAQMDRGIRVAFLDGFGFDPDAAFLGRLGLRQTRDAATAPMTIARATDFFGFEAPLVAHLRERPPVVAGDASWSLLRLKDAAGGQWDGAVLAPWGGAVFSPYMIAGGLENERRWVLDPFRFLQAALALPPIPVPDVTTESGRRILTVHIDGDAFVSRAERRSAPFCGQVVLDEVLRKYPLPHTVSVIEGEVGPAGVYPQLSPKLEAIARAIFALPNVEIGTHLYSHPFTWRDAEAGSRGPPLPFLPVPNYVFDRRREIDGSVEYINTRLAPPGKKVSVVQWTGDCLPSADSVAEAQGLGLLNVNGGGATRVDDAPSLTRGSGMGVSLSPSVYQVFAPVENENLYTNEWRGPFYGYRHAIQTFELNERPRRLSPISIYYHFYSAAKTASLAALHEVYRWALAQETTPLFTSEYVAKVVAFQRLTMARRIDGSGWEIAGYGALHTLRVPSSLGWPVISASSRVAGVRDTPTGRYVHLAPGPSATLVLSDAPSSGPYLEQSNGVVTSWNAAQAPGGPRVALAIHAHVPLVFAAGGVGAGSCSLSTPHGIVAGSPKGNSFVFSLPGHVVEGTLVCH